MKGWMKKVGAVCLTAALATCTLTACDPADYALELVSKPTMTEQAFDEETGLYTILVEGLVYNNSGVALSEVYASINLYDELGDPIEYGSASIGGMDVEEVWHYYALIETEVVPTDIEVTAHGYDW